MREVIAILLLVGCYVVAVDAADPPPMRGLSFAAIITAFIVMFYLGLCIVERMNGMSNWFSIQPGKRTNMEETEWEAMGDEHYAETTSSNIGIETRRTQRTQ